MFCQKNRTVGKVRAVLARCVARIAYWLDNSCDTFIDAYEAYDMRESRVLRRGFCGMFSVLMQDEGLVRRMKVETAFSARSLQVVIRMAVDKFVSKDPVANTEDAFYLLPITAREEYFEEALQEYLAA